MLLTKKSIVTLVTLFLLLVSCGTQDNFYAQSLRSDVFVQQNSDSQYDFLWVFDNSTSMYDRIDYVQDNFSRFLGILTTRKAIDFQMAVTTGDYFVQKGKLMANTSGLTVVKSGDSNPVAEFQSIVSQITDTATSFWDQDLEAAMQAITQYGSTFSRPGVPLNLIIVSDADDYSCAGNCFGVEPRHNTNYSIYPIERYINFFSTVKASQNTNLSFFPLIGLHSSSCGVEDYGSRYIQLSYALTTNMVGSVCNPEISTGYDAIASTISNRGTVFPLNSPSNGQNISVYVNGTVVPVSTDNGYTYDPSSNSIIFSGSAIPANGATITVTYNSTGN